MDAHDQLTCYTMATIKLLQSNLSCYTILQVLQVLYYIDINAASIEHNEMINES